MGGFFLQVKLGRICDAPVFKVIKPSPLEEIYLAEEDDKAAAIRNLDHATLPHILSAECASFDTSWRKRRKGTNKNRASPTDPALEGTHRTPSFISRGARIWWNVLLVVHSGFR